MIASPRLLALLILVAVAACGDDASHDALVRIRPEPAGAHCRDGGQAVSSGLDEDGDGVLGDAEVQDTHYVCSEPGAEALVRGVDEPAGEHCERGGTAVHSGIDRDRDGALDDAEVSSTTYVCKEALLLSITRFEREPAGEHCAAGGTAVHAGLDRDGDHVLSDAEIDATSYVCDAAEVTRVDDVPIGERCPGGGAVVHSGPDRDGDGALGDAEIATTEYVCGSVIAGDVDIITQAEVDALRDIEVITGDLTIRYTADVQAIDLPALRVVGGSLELGVLRSVTRVEAPVLRSVAGGLQVRSVPRLTTLDLPALEVAAWIDISDSAALATVRLPKLAFMGGSISFRDNPITELNLDALEGAGEVSLWSLRVPKLALPMMYSVGGLDVIDCSCLTFSAPSLTYVFGDLRIGRNPTLRALTLPGVKMIEGTLLFRDMPQLVEFALPSLETLGRDFDLWDNATLARFSIPGLQTIPGWFWVSGNPALESFGGLPQLYTVQGQFYFYGNRAMTDMSGLASLSTIGSYAEIGDTRLRRLGMRSLSDVHVFSVGRMDTIPLLDNPLLETIDLPNLREAKSFIVSEAPLLTRFDVPALEVVSWLVTVWNVPGMRRCDLEAWVQGLAVPPDTTHFVLTDETPCQ